MPRPTRFAALLALALAGCTRHPKPRLVIERLSVSEESVAAAPSLGLGADGFREVVKATLERQGAMLLKDGQSPPDDLRPFKLRAEIDSARLEDILLPDGGVGLEAQVEVAMELSRPGADGTFKLSGPGLGRAPAPPPPDLDGQHQAFKHAFATAVERASASLARSAVAVGKGSEELRADLQSPDGGVREAAADVLVDRHDASAVPVLLTELDSDDDNVKLKAIGELVELRAKPAVPKLIDLAQTQDPRLGSDPHFQMQIIYALGAIGGDEAEAYLYTIASGHPDELVRKAAREASTELTRIRDAKSDAKAPPP